MAERTSRKIAPPFAAENEFAPNDMTWHLSLDQIEGETGEITGKRYAPASEAGISTFHFDTKCLVFQVTSVS